MEPTTQNGSLNPARPLAVWSHVLLSITMMAFFYFLPEIFRQRNSNTKFIRTFGVMTMAVFSLIFTEYHDLIVLLTGLFGTITLVPFFIELFKSEYTQLKRWAYLCYFMSVLVFIMYFTEIGIYYFYFTKIKSGNI